MSTLECQELQKRRETQHNRRLRVLLSLAIGISALNPATAGSVELTQDLILSAVSSVLQANYTMCTLRTFKEQSDTRRTSVRLVVSISLFFSVELMLISRGNATLVPEEEKVLESLREGFNQPEWTGDPCATGTVPWIACSNSPSSANLIRLILTDRNLTGTIPAEIAKLEHITELTISGNSLTGPVPDLSNMTGLINLDLSRNNLTGPIPDTFAFTNISDIALNQNNLSGGIPASIFKLGTLQTLNISDNPLGGSIPDMSALTSLTVLSIIKSKISGSIPASIQYVTSLDLIDLSRNPELKGPLPPLRNLNALKQFRAGNCALSGNLPDFRSSQMELVILENNDFSGTLPEGLFQHAALQTLFLSNNPRVSGSIPDMALLSNINSFFANDCNLSGPVPSLSKNLKLQWLGLWNNRLTEFPTELQNLTSLVNIDVHKNNMTGSLPNLPPGSSPTAPTKIQWLTFSENHFSGPIPSSWYELTALQGMLLAFNNLSGILLKEIGNLKSLGNLNLSSNYFSGNLPDELGNLTNLQYLDLRNNQFSGTVPETLASLKSLKTVLLDNNNFTGIHESLTKKQGILISYGGNPGMKILKSSGESGSAGTIIGAVIGACASVGVAVVAIMLYAKKRKRKYGDQVRKEDMPKSAQSFPLKQIKVITENYKTLIGKGGFGNVYYGKLSDGKEVAVKVRFPESKQGTGEFLNEVSLLSRLHHRNIVALVGYCLDEQQQILVYDFMTHGTVHDHLYRKGSRTSSTYPPLNWKTRLDIAINAARGLEYLHKDCNPPIIHRDVKSSNILLNNKLQAKVSDLGISKQAPELDIEEGFTQSGVCTLVRGTVGYFDPEYLTHYRLTPKSDVYSFGVVLLEIITAQRPQTETFPDSEATDLIAWVRNAVSSDRLEAIVDPKLGGEYDRESMLRVARLAVSCIHPSGAERPDMGEIARTLTQILQMEGVYTFSSSSANHETVPLSTEQELPLSSTSHSEISTSSSAYAHPSWITDPR